MDSSTTLGQRLKQRRKELGRWATQEWLSGQTGLSVHSISQFERGKTTPKLSTLATLALALDCEIGDLTDRRERMGPDRDGGSVLALRDALLSPTALPGWPHGDGEPVSIAELDQRVAISELDQRVSKAWRCYWSGDFGKLLATLPGLLADARRARAEHGPLAARGLSLAHELAAHLFTQVGRTDLGTIAAERSIAAAYDGRDEDELLYAAQHATYSWTLHHQGRYGEAEQVAADMANRVEPSMSSATPLELGVWGHLLLTTIAPCVAVDKDPVEYLRMAGAGAERLGGRARVFQTSFAAPSVHMQETYAYSTLRQPSKALKAARKIAPGDLKGISRGAHLMDVAQAHWVRGYDKAAEVNLLEARGISRVWFAHQRVPAAIVTDIREKQSRPSEGIRDLADTLGV